MKSWRELSAEEKRKRAQRMESLAKIAVFLFLLFFFLVTLERALNDQRAPSTTQETTEEAAESHNQGSTQTSVSSPALPDFTIVEIKDISYSTVRRYLVTVTLPEHYSQSAVEQIAQAIVADITKSKPVNAICIRFYGPGADTRGAADVAQVDWAPNGRWEDADSVRAGDYTSFRYTVDYKAPAPTPTGLPTLKVSKRTGLLGVPLPEGAQLIQKTPGDPASGRDPSERYAVSASAAEIARFFNRVMREAGWLKNGLSTSTWLLFRKGEHMIGIEIDKNGGIFTLLGS